jgi:universal stress protein A
MNALIKKILVPVDFSASSERAANYAATLARQLGASLHLVHALEPCELVRGPFEFFESPSAGHLDDLYWAARTRLTVLSRKLGLADRTSKEVRPGLASEVIKGAAVDLGADLVIMSSHGRSGLSHLLMGSVAERVMRSVPCPVLIIRDSERLEVHQPVTVESTTGDMPRAS